MVFFNGIPLGRIRFASISLQEIIKLALQFSGADMTVMRSPRVGERMRLDSRYHVTIWPARFLEERHHQVIVSCQPY